MESCIDIRYSLQQSRVSLLSVVIYFDGSVCIFRG